MFSIHDEAKIKELLIANGEKSFRYAQIEHAIYKELRSDFSEITTLSKPVRELLSTHCFHNSLQIDSEHTSENGQTTKFLLRTVDDRLIECVIMRHLSGRNTLCVSSQVGCPMACVFCATGKLGLTRNLEFYEILDQIMIAVQKLATHILKLSSMIYCLFIFCARFLP